MTSCILAGNPNKTELIFERRYENCFIKLTQISESQLKFADSVKYLNVLPGKN